MLKLIVNQYFSIEIFSRRFYLDSCLLPTHFPGLFRLLIINLNTEKQ